MKRLKISESRRGPFTVWPLFNIQILIMTEEVQLSEMKQGVVYLELMR